MLFRERDAVDCFINRVGGALLRVVGLRRPREDDFVRDAGDDQIAHQPVGAGPHDGFDFFDATERCRAAPDTSTGMLSSVIFDNRLTSSANLLTAEQSSLGSTRTHVSFQFRRPLIGCHSQVTGIGEPDTCCRGIRRRDSLATMNRPSVYVCDFGSSNKKSRPVRAGEALRGPLAKKTFANVHEKAFTMRALSHSPQG